MGDCQHEAISKSSKHVAGDVLEPTYGVDHPGDRSTHRSRRGRGRRCDGGSAMNARIQEGVVLLRVAKEHLATMQAIIDRLAALEGSGALRILAARLQELAFRAGEGSSN